jgi:hypothetical protein
MNKSHLQIFPPPLIRGEGQGEGLKTVSGYWLLVSGLSSFIVVSWESSRRQERKIRNCLKHPLTLTLSPSRGREDF